MNLTTNEHEQIIIKERLSNFINMYSDFIEELLKDEYFKDHFVTGFVFNKIRSNLHAAIYILDRGFFQEAQIILRSALESSLLLLYIMESPDKEKEYIETNFILQFKNDFITYKNRVKYYNKDINVVKQYEAFLIGKFKQYSKYLERIMPKEICDSLSNGIIPYQKLEKYFKGDGRPKWTSVEYLMREVSINFEEFSLREYVYEIYNILSQLSHSALPSWMQRPDLNIKTFWTIYRYFYAPVAISILAVKKHNLSSPYSKYIDGLESLHMKISEIVDEG